MEINNTDLGPSRAPDWRAKVYGRALGGSARRYPTPKTKARISERQANRCLYCGHTIGSEITRRGKPVILRPQYDHFVPYSYTRRNPHDGWVLACHVCNNIKHCRIFASVVDAQEFIQRERLSKGYTVHALDAPGKPS